MYIYLEMSGSCKRENEWAYKGESESLVKDWRPKFLSKVKCESTAEVTDFTYSSDWLS